MDLRDATLMFLIESAAHPAVSEIAQSAYDRLVAGEDIDYRVLSDLVDEASGKGVLRAMHQKYGPAAFEAIVMPVLQEIGRRAPIRSTRRTWQPGEGPADRWYAGQALNRNGPRRPDDVSHNETARGLARH
ncbi:MAG TPA: hypothetical protein VKG87_02670 [Terriglobales bacterium]|nr:hypothetical protein [Terriglobales bacterium]